MPSVSVRVNLLLLQLVLMRLQIKMNTLKERCFDAPSVDVSAQSSTWRDHLADKSAASWDLIRPNADGRLKGVVRAPMRLRLRLSQIAVPFFFPQRFCSDVCHLERKIWCV